MRLTALSYHRPAIEYVSTDPGSRVGVSELAASTRAAYVRSVYALTAKAAAVMACIAYATGCGYGQRLLMHVPWLWFVSLVTWTSLCYWAQAVRNRPTLAVRLLFAMAVAEGSCVGPWLAYVALGHARQVAEAALLTGLTFGTLTCYAMNGRIAVDGLRPLLAVLWATGTAGIFLCFVVRAAPFNIAVTILCLLAWALFIVADTVDVDRRTSTNQVAEDAVKLYVDIMGTFYTIQRLLLLLLRR